MQAKQTLRLFISSTFNDLKAERNALQENVFPRLREEIAEYGHLQVIDLRWGVSEEASLDQQAMNICLKEIERCQQTTPRPNFLVLLGDRYGWRPPLSQIPDKEFRMIEKKIDNSDFEFLKKWYTLDKNAVPEEWRLNPRDPEGAYKDYANWAPVEERLYKILSTAAKGLGTKLGERLLHYTASATEQEIAAGALRVDEAHKHVHCFFRSIEGVEYIPNNFNSQAFQTQLTEKITELYGNKELNKANQELLIKLAEMPPGSAAKEFDEHIKAAQDLASRDTLEKEVVDFIQQTLVDFVAKEFINLNEDDWSVDEEAYKDQNRLKDRLTKNLPASNIHNTYQAKWTGEGISTDHIARFCEDVYESLLSIIMEQVKHPHEITSSDKKEVKIKTDEMLDEEGVTHHQFAEERMSFFVGRTQILKNIQSYLKADQRQILAIVGEGGTGKSSLSAKAIQETQENFPKSQIVYRFIGATPGSSDGRTLLESLCREISRRYGVDEEKTPTDYSDLVRELGMQMRLATAEKPLILFLDSLDQLFETNDARSLTWLPPELPEHTSVITSTREEDTFDSLKIKQAQVEELEGLDRKDGKKLLSEWLENAGRKLQEPQQKYVLDKFEESKGYPLYLKLAFEEARLWTSKPDTPHEEFALGVRGIIENNMFDRLMEEVNHGKALVSRALGYLAASRDGLTEDELVDLLSRDIEVYRWFMKGTYHLPEILIKRAVEYRRKQSVDENVEASVREERAAFSWLKGNRTPPDEVQKFLSETLPNEVGLSLPVVFWSRLYLDISAFLNQRTVNGSLLLNFYHRELGEAAKIVFLADGQDQLYHTRLADYFADRNLDRRKTDELPWQYTQTGSWQKLHDLLADLNFFSACWKADDLEVRAYWAQVEGNSSLRLGDAYQHVIKDPAQYSKHVWKIALFLDNMGYLDEAIFLQEYLIDHFRQSGDLENLQAALGNQALILKKRGDLDGATALNIEKERICRDMGNKDSLATSLGNQAIVLKTRGDLDGAMKLHKEEERICRELGNKDSLQMSLGNQAVILQTRGDLDGAMALHKEKERICRELGKKDSLQFSLGNQGCILYSRGDLDGAMALQKEAEHICRELGDNDGLSRSLGNQALILKKSGDLDGAMGLHKEEESICRELGDGEGLCCSLANQASILGIMQNQKREALSLANEAYQLAADHGFVSLARQIKGIRSKIAGKQGR